MPDSLNLANARVVKDFVNNALIPDPDPVGAFRAKELLRPMRKRLIGKPGNGIDHAYNLLAR